MTNHPEVFTIYDILAKHISAAWSGQTSVDDALEAAQEELRRLLR
jgi:ABC-type glycerol-3-phosphate transport system substrate-binding protein